jgi:DNA-3-methyladenine glycosylase
MKKILTKDFYLNNDVCDIAFKLLGKQLSVRHDDVVISGIITETEAYAGIIDRASHAYNNRRTKRTETMYCEGGVAYVYLCYGIHSLFNVVTNKKDIPDAVLIRSVFPINEITSEEFESAFQRGIGPGKASKSLGITLNHNGLLLTGEEIFISDIGLKVHTEGIRKDQRIGIEYAGEDALLPYRFYIDKTYLKTQILNEQSTNHFKKGQI